MSKPTRSLIAALLLPLLQGVLDAVREQRHQVLVLFALLLQILLASSELLLLLLHVIHLLSKLGDLLLEFLVVLNKLLVLLFERVLLLIFLLLSLRCRLGNVLSTLL